MGSPRRRLLASAREPSSLLGAIDAVRRLNTQHSTRCTQHSKLNTQHSTRYTQHSTLNTQHSTLNTLHSTLKTQHTCASAGGAVGRFRATRGHLETFSALSPGCQGQNLALTVLSVPSSLDSGAPEPVVVLVARGVVHVARGGMSPDPVVHVARPVT